MPPVNRLSVANLGRDRKIRRVLLYRLHRVRGSKMLRVRLGESVAKAVRNKVALLFVPYTAPALRRGDRTTCLA